MIEVNNFCIDFPVEMDSAIALFPFEKINSDRTEFNPQR
jgi:hypothetical protein